MKSKELVIGKQVVVQLAETPFGDVIGQQLVGHLMPNRWRHNIQCAVYFAKNVYRILGKKVKFDLQTRFLVRTLLSNNTPQASNQFRLITAQTEGLLVSGGLK